MAHSAHRKLLGDVVDNILVAIQGTDDAAAASIAATLAATLSDAAKAVTETNHLSEDLHTTKSYLDWYAQTLFQFGTAERLDGATLQRIDRMFIQPVVGVIRTKILQKIEAVRRSPSEYQAAVKEIAEADDLIYNGVFMKHAKDGGFKAALARLIELFQAVEFVDQKQPVKSHLIAFASPLCSKWLCVVGGVLQGRGSQHRDLSLYFAGSQHQVTLVLGAASICIHSTRLGPKDQAIILVVFVVGVAGRSMTCWRCRSW